MNHYKTNGLTYEELSGGSGDLEKEVRVELLADFKNKFGNNGLLPTAKFTKEDLGKWLEYNADKNLFVYLGVKDNTKQYELILIFEFIEISATGTLSNKSIIGYYENEILYKTLNKKDAEIYYENFINFYKPDVNKLQGFVWGYKALKNVHKKLKKEQHITLYVGHFKDKFVFYGIPSAGNYQYIAYRNEAVEPTVLGIPPMDPNL